VVTFLVTTVVSDKGVKVKLQCKQCGAAIAVTSPGSYISCPYCGAKAVITGFSGTSFFHRITLSEKEVLRLFKPGTIASTSLYWFPYKQSPYKRVFTQPYPELENYLPPSASRGVWNSDEIEGNIIPIDPELLDDSGVIYHPIWVAISSSSSQGLMVDAVSGQKLGLIPDENGTVSFNPFQTAKKAFFISIIPALFFFFILKNFSVFWASALSMVSAVIAPGLWTRISNRGDNE